MASGWKRRICIDNKYNWKVKERWLVMQKYKVAGYIRLSKEDKIKDESNSVTNQKLIITSHILKRIKS